MSAWSEAMANLMENPEAKAFLSKLKGGPLSEEAEGALQKIAETKKENVPTAPISSSVNEQSLVKSEPNFTMTEPTAPGQNFPQRSTDFTMNDTGYSAKEPSMLMVPGEESPNIRDVSEPDIIYGQGKVEDNSIKQLSSGPSEKLKTSPISSEEMSNHATDYSTPEAEPKAPMSPLAKNALIAAGIGGAGLGTGALLMGGDQGQPPSPTASVTTPPAQGEAAQPQDTAAQPAALPQPGKRMPSGSSANMSDIKAREDAALAKLGGPSEESFPSLSLLNFGSADQNKNELADVQQRQNMAELVNRLGKAGAYIGAGIARTPVVAPDEFDKNIAAAKNITQQYLDRKANEENDPNSGISKAFRDYVKNFGVNVTSGASAGQLKQVVPYIFKDFEAKQAQKVRQEDIQMQQQNRKDIAAMHSQDLKARYAELAANKQNAQADKETKQDQQNQLKVQQQLESVRGDKALQNAKETIRRVASAEKILSQYPDLNKVPVNISNMIITDLGTIVSGGVLGHEGFKEISNPTLYSKLSEQVQNLGNRPTGAQLGAFLQQNRKLLQELASTAESQIEDKYRRILNTSGKILKPESRELYRNEYLPHDKADKAGRYYREQQEAAGAAPIFDPNAAAAELARRQKGNQ